MLVPLCALFGGRLGAKEGAFETRVLAIGLWAKPDMADAPSSTLVNPAYEVGIRRTLLGLVPRIQVLPTSLKRIKIIQYTQIRLENTNSPVVFFKIHF